MDEQTGTDAELFEASDIESVANEPMTEQANDDTSSAVEVTNEQTDSEEQEANDEPAVSTTQTGDAIDEFLAKKGINPSDPDALRKVADMYRNSEKGFYRKSQEKAQLERRLNESRIPEERPNLQAMSEVRALRQEIETERWKQQHNLSAEDEAKMVEYINQPLVDSQGRTRVNPATGQPITKGMLVLNGSLSLDDVYRLSGAGQVKTDNLKAAYRKEVEKEMAARQAAKRPTAQATNSTQFGKAEDNDPFLSGLFG